MTCDPTQSAGAVVRNRHSQSLLHALSFDVEEWFHAHNLAVPHTLWPSLPSRLQPMIDGLLHGLDRHGTRATFFVLGWIARRWPELVRRIHAAGHEIACHGYMHERIDRLTPDQLRRDVRDARDLLQDICGVRVIGYRAPAYSITHNTAWALPVLAEEGFAYDSSVYPSRLSQDHGCSLAGIERPMRLNCGLWEFPLPSIRLFPGLACPALTGGFFRCQPWRLSRRAIEQNVRRGAPVVVNLHPWEFDPGQPEWPTSPINRWKHRVGLASTAGKLRRLLNCARFGSLRELYNRYIGAEGNRAAKPVRHVLVHAKRAAAETALVGCQQPLGFEKASGPYETPVVTESASPAPPSSK